MGHVPQRPVHRARHQADRRLHVRAVAHRAGVRDEGRPSLGLLGVLLEPTTVVTKAWEQADASASARVLGAAHRARHRRRPDRPAGGAGRQAARARRARARPHQGRPKPESSARSGPRITPARAPANASVPDVLIECTGVAAVIADWLDAGAPAVLSASPA